MPTTALRRGLVTAAAILAAVFLWLLATLPDLPRTAGGAVDDAIRRRTVAGAFHVHSTVSDGAGSKREIAAAAARAGLRFVVMTDHGDGARQPDPPEYIDNVLVIDGVEISTNGGHYIALDMPAAPYPLGGEASAVIEDVHRLGGFGIVAHGDSAKPELKWSDWAQPVDGLEWLNIDSEWRDESRGRLLRAGLDYAFRKGPALASIIDRPAATLERWDAIAREHRALCAVAGHDAHGGWGAEGRGRPGIRGIPSYEASFRTFAIRAILDREPSGNAAADSRSLLEAIRSCRVFTAIDAIAVPAFVDYRAMLPSETQIVVGQSAEFAHGISLTFRSTIPEGGRAVMLANGVKVAESATGELRASANQPGAYRVEVTVPRAPGTPPIPWLVTNPIYLWGPRAAPGLAPRFISVRALGEPGSIEKDPGSTATVSAAAGSGPDDVTRTVQYRLRPDVRASQYAALSIPVPEPRPSYDALAFRAQSSAPMRVSVQLRLETLGGARWGYSVYVSPEPALITVPLARLVPLDGRPTPPQLSSASSILFVVDLTNARPGGEGRFEISQLQLGSLVK